MRQSQTIISTDPRRQGPPDAAQDAPAPGAEAVTNLPDDEPGEAEQRHLVVPDALHGERLDRALAALVSEFSRSYLQQLVQAGHLRLGTQVCTKPAQRLRAGDALSLTLLPTPQAQAFRPEPMALPIVYEDEHLLVIDKPAGLVVHPAAGNWSGTLLNGLLAHDAQCAALPRAGIVHRLDKDTSGLMVVARSRQAMDALVQAIAAREVRRQYWALAHRAWEGPALREVEAPIGRDPRNRLRMAVVDLAHHSGKPAATGIERLANAGDYCLVECTLRTGRTHQIRVHMAHIDHPLVADTLYGGRPALGLQRQALHARRLAFGHPVTGEPLAFESALPADFAAALRALGLAS